MMNYLRNNTTGKQYNFDSMPMAGQSVNALMPDYAQPIDIGGMGKGYRVKGDPYSVMLQDGRTVQIGVDQEATRKAQMGNLEMEKAGLANKLLRAQINAAGQRDSPSYQHVDTPSGAMAFNPKTGQMMPITAPGGGAIPNKDQMQRGNDATSVMELTDEAAPLIDQAPGSYFGAAANQLGRVVGMDTDATKAQAQLDVLSGSLISKMPKMSGPQSDKDVALYKAMAGNLNDPTLPASAKTAAMKTLRLLNERYATGYKGQGGQSPGIQPAASGPAVGSVDGGHMFLGGDPGNPASWKRVQ
jgi:hypothetical protein